MGRGGAQARRGVHRRRRRRDHDPLQGQVPREMFLSVFKFEKKVPVATVPTYSSISELIAEGSSIIIYASHLLRAAYPMMIGVAESILTNARSAEADATLVPPVLHTCCAKLMPGGQSGGVDRGREERR